MQIIRRLLHILTHQVITLFIYEGLLESINLWSEADSGLVHLVLPATDALIHDDRPLPVPLLHVCLQGDLDIALCASLDIAILLHSTIDVLLRLKSALGV